MKKLLLIVSLFILGILLFTACGQANQGATEAGHVNTSPYEDFLVVDVFSSRANYQGLQAGFFAQIVRERFNMELNIIAPNVAGGGDMLFQTRAAAGNLGDIIIHGAGGGVLQDLVTGGLLTDISQYINPNGYLAGFMPAVNNLNGLVSQDGIWGIPMEVSMQPATNPMEGLEPTFGPYLRWDLFAELGYPQINSLDDLLDVLEAMQNLKPYTEDGFPVYALSLFPDWDGDIMVLAKQPANLFGYDEVGYVLLRADGTSMVSMLDSDSLYIEALRFFNEAYRRGILDPESATQSWSDLFAKYQNGQVLFSFWPWLGQSAFNTTENLEAGRGFMFAPINGMEVFSFGANPLGSDTFIGVGSSAVDPQRMADFIEWLYSPEGIDVSGTGMGAAPGPRGLTWDIADGEPVLTEFGERVILGGEDIPVPDEFGGGTFLNGVSQLNFPAVIATDINPTTGFPYDLALWPSVQRDFGSNPVVEDWRTHMNAMNTMEFLKNNNMLAVAPGSGFITPEEPMEITTLRGMIRNVVVPTSWRMVYATTTAEFESLLAEMQERAYGLGFAQVLEIDMQNAKNWNEARLAAAN